MQKPAIIIVITFIGLALIAQEIQHDTITINIEVPVRVFKGDSFVDTLTIDDFEVYEEGELQKIEAVYLIKETSIERENTPEQAERKNRPVTSRNFVFIFEINDYLPEVDEAIDYFFQSVLLPGDNFLVTTPQKQYRLKSDLLKNMKMEEVARLVKERIKTDVRKWGAHYHSLIREIRSLLLEEFEGADLSLVERFSRVYELYNQWNSERHIGEENLTKFADYLKETDQQKHVFVFYQKEVLPALGPKAMMMLEANIQSKPYVLQQARDLFNFYKVDVSLDLNRVKEVFSDSSITSHFLYITMIQPYELDVTSRQSTMSRGIIMDEKQTEISVIFKEMAEATGGLVESSANAAFAFKRAVESSEHYYLVYYSPKNYTADGKFKRIDVKVRGGNYRITHRAGYIAD